MGIVDPQDHHVELSVTEARQGRRGLHALIILIVSTLLTVIAFLGAYAVNHRNLASVNTAPMASKADANLTDVQLWPHGQPSSPAQ